jgi:hypothetical protein
MTKHDPARDASLYLGGMMSRRGRRRFEHHIIRCEECWQEVEVGRRGRALAESARELAPQDLRELVRSTVAATATPRRRVALGLWVGALAAGVAALVVVALVLQPGQPREIEVLLADFRAPELDRQAAADLPERLGDLELGEVRRGRVGDMPVVVHDYADPAGHTVSVYQSNRTFPVAEGAEHAAIGQTWSATVDGTVMFCADRPVPSLVIGDDAREVRLASLELGLR